MLSIQESAEARTWRQLLLRDLRALRRFIEARVPCKGDHPDAVSVVPNSFFRTGGSRWLADCQGTPNPMRQLFHEYLDAGYIALNEPLPADEPWRELSGATQFELAVRFARDPAVVPLLLEHGADETLLRTERDSMGLPARAVDFPDFVFRCALERATFKQDPESVAQEAAAARAMALVGLMRRRIRLPDPASASLPLEPAEVSTDQLAARRRTIHL